MARVISFSWGEVFRPQWQHKHGIFNSQTIIKIFYLKWFLKLRESDANICHSQS